MTTHGKATGKSERLVVLSNAEQEVLYGLPDFNDAQRLEFLDLDEPELTLACSRQGFHAQFIASSRSLISKPNICFSASGGMMLRMTAILP